MTAQKIFDNTIREDLTDIIFEHRNKAYGAYELRKHYDKRITKSMLITLTVFLLLFFLAYTFAVKESPVWKFSNIKGKSVTFKKLVLPSLILPPAPTIKSQQSKTNPDNKNFKVISTVTLPLLKPDSDKVTNQKPIGIATTPFTVAGPSITNTHPDHQPESGNGQSSFRTDGTILHIAEVMPQFPGGDGALQKYLANHIKFTNSALDAHATGKIYLDFVIDVDGSISDIKVLHDDIGYGCAQNAINVIQNMPTWIPGNNNGHVVRVEMMLPITYQTF